LKKMIENRYSLKCNISPPVTLNRKQSVSCVFF
jgi:hypothetical protein